MADPIVYFSTGTSIAAVLGAGIAMYRAKPEVQKIKAEINTEDASAGALISEAAVNLLKPMESQLARVMGQLVEAEATIERMGITLKEQSHTLDTQSDQINAQARQIKEQSAQLDLATRKLKAYEKKFGPLEEVY